MILEIVILFLGIPTGFLIAYLARDELVVGRIWIKVLFFLAFIGIVLSWILQEGSYAWTFGFIAIVAFVSLVVKFRN